MGLVPVTLPRDENRGWLGPFHTEYEHVSYRRISAFSTARLDNRPFYVPNIRGCPGNESRLHRAVVDTNPSPLTIRTFFPEREGTSPCRLNCQSTVPRESALEMTLISPCTFAGEPDLTPAFLQGPVSIPAPFPTRVSSASDSSFENHRRLT